MKYAFRQLRHMDTQCMLKKHSILHWVLQASTHTYCTNILCKPTRVELEMICDGEALVSKHQPEKVGVQLSQGETAFSKIQLYYQCGLCVYFIFEDM